MARRTSTKKRKSKRASTNRRKKKKTPIISYSDSTSDTDSDLSLDALIAELDTSSDESSTRADSESTDSEATRRPRISKRSRRSRKNKISQGDTGKKQDLINRKGKRAYNIARTRTRTIAAGKQRVPIAQGLLARAGKHVDDTINSLREDWDEQLVTVDSPNDYTTQELVAMALQATQGTRDVMDLRALEQTMHMRQISARLHKMEQQQKKSNENNDKVIMIMAATVFLLLLIYFIKHVPGGSSYVRTFYYLFLAGVFTAGGSVLIEGASRPNLQRGPLRVRERQIPARNRLPQQQIDF